MKKILSALAVSAIPFSAAQAAIDGTTASATGSAGTVVITPIQVSHDTGATLSFGTIMGTTINSTMRVGTDGTNTGSTGAIAWATGSKTSADAFTITGEPNKAITISVPNVITMTGTGTGAPTLSVFPSLSQTTGTLSSTGTLKFTVGGYYSVALPPASGTYSGTYQVTVAYN